MRKYRNTLGLHTAEEQSQALGIATGAFQQAAQSLNEGNIREYTYLYGYISGIQGLADAEKQQQLVNDIQVLRERLVMMERTRE
jgi:hypothetical protein